MRPEKAKSDDEIAGRIKQWDLELEELRREAQLDQPPVNARFTALNGILTDKAREHFDDDYGETEAD